MKRLTTEKSIEKMNMHELAHNCMYVKSKEAWYRDYDREIPLRELMRRIAEGNKVTLPEADEELDAELCANRQFEPERNIEGLLGLVYILGCALADNREQLKAYEDTGLTPQEIMDGNLLTGWIPVGERLPEEGEEVLASTDNGVIYMVEYDSDFGFDDVDAMAWMPLPEPCKTEKKEGDAVE